MKSIDGPSKKVLIQILKLMVLSLIMMISCYGYHGYNTFKSIKVVVSDSPTIEYGTANYDVKKLIKEVDGEVISVKQDIDTNTLGAQEVILEVSKDNVVKEIPIVVSVIDSTAPVIKLKNEKITITEGDSYNLNENIESVSDLIDGDLNYIQDAIDGSLKYYSINYNDDISTVGTHEITINAVDNSGNVSVQKFTLEVVEPEKPQVQQTYGPVDPNTFGGDLAAIAYSLVGRPYVSGGNSPSGFDCSGFVQYVYSTIGINISRSTYTQLNDGVPVNYSDAQPGDIVIWGYGNVATHSSMYVGGDTMVHAANPSTGVIASSISGWLRGSGTQIVGVRRIK